MDSENITFRNYRCTKSMENLSSSSLYDDNTQFNLSRTSTDQNQDKINKKIESLTQQLKAANYEIQKLCTENKNLKTELETSQKIIDMYKHLGYSDSPYAKSSTRKRKKPKLKNINDIDSISQLASSNNLQDLDNQVKTFDKIDITVDETTDYNITKPQAVDPVIIVQSSGQISDYEDSETDKYDKETDINKKQDDNEIGKHDEQVQSIDYDEIETMKDDKQVQSFPTESSNDDIKLQINMTEHKSAARKYNTKTKNKVIVLADHQGRNVSITLQDLLGDNYEVTCVWKQSAKLDNILNLDQTLYNLTENDYIVIIGGSNDDNPFELKNNLIYFFKSLSKPNIILLEVPYNRFLNERKINYELRNISRNYLNVNYVDMDYSRIRYRKMTFTLKLCRTLLKEICRINYYMKRAEYEQKQIRNRDKTYNNKATQTDFTINNDNAKNFASLPTNSDKSNCKLGTEKFFRK